MKRRTTLGEVTNATLNSRPTTRASMMPLVKRAGGGGGLGGGPGRMSLNVVGNKARVSGPPGRASLAAPRHSLAATNSSAGGGAGGGGGACPPRKSSMGVRRGSTFGVGGMGGGSSALKGDPRPITDKAFKNECIRALVKYLADYGYDQPISAKILTRPSGRDFNNIMGFLFRQYDPAWQPSPGARFEDEVIPFLKSIRYPFTLSKSLLQAVGAPQSWPKALAAISWMVELLNYDQEVAAHEAERQDKRAAGDADGIADHVLDDKAFFEYLSHAYKCFLDGDEDGLASLEQDLVGTFEHQNGIIQAEVTALQTRNASLREATEAVLSRAGALPELQQRQRDCASDLDKFQQLIQQLEGHREALRGKVEARGEEEEKAKAELAAVRDQIAGLRERIANQELSAEDVQRMSLERQRLRDGMVAAADHKTKAQKRGWEAEMQLSRRLEALENAVHSYNSKAQALQLVPASAKNANGQDYELDINRNNLEDEEHVLTNDVRGHIRPALTAMRDAVVRRMHEARQQLLELLDQEEASEEQLTELTDSQASLEAKVKRLEEAYRREKEALDALIASKAAAASALERRLSAARDPGDAASRTAAARARAGALRAALERQRAAHGAELGALQTELHTVLVEAWDFKEETGAALAALQGRARAAVEAVEGCSALDGLRAAAAEVCGGGDDVAATAPVEKGEGGASHQPLPAVDEGEEELEASGADV